MKASVAPEQYHGRASPTAWPVYLVVFLVAVGFIVAAYFTDRDGAVDEVGLYNPTYMALHYGKTTYPVHGYFDSTVVHPPVHYYAVAVLMRAGVTLYYAEATPALAMLLFALFLIVRSDLPVSLKLGLSVGLYSPIALLSNLRGELFGFRPEMHLGAAWVAGLVALDWGRTRGWEVKRLFLGSFLITYASGLHYYAVAAAGGALAYGALAVWDLGRRGARRALIALALGSLLFGLPYLGLYVVPQGRSIVTMISSVQGEPGVGRALEAHRSIYEFWMANGSGVFWQVVPLTAAVPMVVISTALLLGLPRSRGIALAALPLQLFLLFVARRKHSYYFIHESSLYAAALIATALSLLGAALRKVRIEKTAHMAMASLALTFYGSLLYYNHRLPEAEVSFRSRIHEAEVARASGRTILGPNARIGGRLGAWYASGAAHWYWAERDVVWPAKLSIDVSHFFRQFDAVVDHYHMSNATYNDQRTTFSTWYANDALKLAGFFFSEDNADLTYYLLRAKRPYRITGFALRAGTLYRFSEGNGGHRLVRLVCALDPNKNEFWLRMPVSGILLLAQPLGRKPQEALVHMIIPPDLGHPETVRPDCRVLPEIRGSLDVVDHRAMVERLRQEDKPIRFYEHLEDMPGFQSPDQPPEDAVSLGGALQLSRMTRAWDKASVTLGNPVLVSTAPGMGAFAATLPIQVGAQVDRRAWIKIRARVLKGRVAFGVFDEHARSFLRETAGHNPGEVAKDHYLALPSLRGADSFVVRSADAGQPSEVAIEELRLWVEKAT